MATIVLNENDKKNFKLILVVFIVALTALVSFFALRWTTIRAAETTSTAVQKSVSGAKASKEKFDEASARKKFDEEAKKLYPGATVNVRPMDVDGVEEWMRSWQVEESPFLDKYRNRPNTYFYVIDAKFKDGSYKWNVHAVFLEDGHWKVD